MVRTNGRKHFAYDNYRLADGLELIVVRERPLGGGGGDKRIVKHGFFRREHRGTRARVIYFDCTIVCANVLGVSAVFRLRSKRKRGGRGRRYNTQRAFDAVKTGISMF